MSVSLELATDVLVPRQETEVLGREAIAILRGQCGPRPMVIDMCCGSGNLGLAIASELPTSRVWCADLTDGAVTAARVNVERLAVKDRVTVRQGDLFGAFEADRLAGAADMIVCNPPYISTARLEGDSAHLLRSEPREAFDGGPYGLSIHQRLVREALGFLKPGGWLLFEFGEGQHRQVAALTARAKAYEPVSFVNDKAGMPRVAVLRMLRAGAPAAGGA